MSIILNIDDLRKLLSTTYSSRETPQESKIKRKQNINSFLEIDRSGLSHKNYEKRLLLYTTPSNEKIYIQYPGIEAIRNVNAMPRDFRPEFQFSDGTFLSGATFGWLWDILAGIAQRHQDYMDIVAAVIFRLGYMVDYVCSNDEVPCSLLDFAKGTSTKMDSEHINWYHLAFDDEIWNSLNNYIGNIPLSNNQSMSFEGLIKFFDLLLQNEDCKYYYKKVIQDGKDDYKLENGRTSTCNVNLLVVSYLQGHVKLSSLLNSFQRPVMAGIRKGDYPTVTGGLVTFKK